MWTDLKYLSKYPNSHFWQQNKHQQTSTNKYPKQTTNNIYQIVPCIAAHVDVNKYNGIAILPIGPTLLILPGNTIIIIVIKCNTNYLSVDFLYLPGYSTIAFANDVKCV